VSGGRRILLINPSLGDYYRHIRVGGAISTSPPLNLAALAGALVAQGHRVRVVDLAVQGERVVARVVRRFAPDLVGITVRTPLLPAAQVLARQVRRLAPGALVVGGGPHATTRPEDLLSRGFDVVVMGEGEEALCELAEGRPLPEATGIVYRSDGGVVRTSAGRRVVDLDRLAYPAWHLFDLARYRKRSLVAPHPPVADLESSRGCAASCIYCTHSVHGRRFRAKTPRRFVDEVSHALRAGFRSFNLVDDNFTADQGRAVAICEEILRRRLRVRWTLTNGIRVPDGSKAFFRVAARAGLELVAFGIESGTQSLLDGVGKGATLKQAREAVAAARAEGILTVGYFMVGLPGETVESLVATAAFARELDLDFAKFSITLPLPGTALFRTWARFIRPEYLPTLNIHRNNRDLLTHPDLSWSELEGFLTAAYRAFYFRPDYLLRRLVRDMRNGRLLVDAVSALGIRW